MLVMILNAGHFYSLAVYDWCVTFRVLTCIREFREEFCRLIPCRHLLHIVALVFKAALPQGSKGHKHSVLAFILVPRVPSLVQIL